MNNMLKIDNDNLIYIIRQNDINTDIAVFKIKEQKELEQVLISYGSTNLKCTHSFRLVGAGKSCEDKFDLKFS